MRIRISVDGYGSEIDSTDPQTLGRWMVEIFARYPDAGPQTIYQVFANPSHVYNRKSGQYHSDWIQDTRYLEVGRARSPRELLTELTAWLDAYEARDDD